MTGPRLLKGYERTPNLNDFHQGVQTLMRENDIFANPDIPQVMKLLQSFRVYLNDTFGSEGQFISEQSHAEQLLEVKDDLERTVQLIDEMLKRHACSDIRVVAL